VYVPGLVRVGLQNPLDDVRLPLAELIEELKANSILVPEAYDEVSEQPSDYAPSSFIPPKKLPQITKSEDTRQFLEETYLSKARFFFSI